MLLVFECAFQLSFWQYQADTTHLSVIIFFFLGVWNPLLLLLEGLDFSTEGGEGEGEERERERVEGEGLCVLLRMRMRELSLYVYVYFSFFLLSQED